MIKIKTFLCGLLLLFVSVQLKAEMRPVPEKSGSPTVVYQVVNDTALEKRISLLELKDQANKDWTDTNHRMIDHWIYWVQVLLAVLVIAFGAVGYFVVKKYAQQAKDDAEKAAANAKSDAEKAHEQSLQAEAFLSKIDGYVQKAEVHTDVLAKMTEKGEEQLTKISLEEVRTPADKEVIKSIIEESLKENTLDSLKNLIHARAIKAYDDENFEEALRLFNYYVDLFDGDGNIYFSRGYVNGMLVNYKEAVSDWSKSIILDSNFSPTYYNRGLLFQKLGENEKAMNDYRKAIELDNKNVFAHINRGTLYNELGDNENALINYEKALQLNPNIALLYYNMGNAYSDLDEKELALDKYDKAIKLDPTYVDAYWNRSTVYERLGNKELAQKDKAKAIELDPHVEERAKNNNK